MTVRMIVVWRLSTGQKTALYTNDKTSPMEKLAAPMTRRWSEQENIFQKMMRRYKEYEKLVDFYHTSEHLSPAAREGGEKILNLRVFVKSDRWGSFWENYMTLKRAA